MKLIKPSYFDTFRCIASACPDSCCKEWDVAVDAGKAALYRSLPGALGEQLRQVLKDEGEQTYMTIENGRCPMWRDDGLCRIQAELGEEALCKTCREFPRLTHDYGDFVEMGLEMSCPEAARLILSASSPAMTETELTGGEEPEYDTEAMAVLLRTRDVMRRILSDESHSVPQTLALALMYGYQAQAELDGEPEAAFDGAAALESAMQFAAVCDMTPMLNYFRNLEILTEEWASRLEKTESAPWAPEYRALARYFVDRYWLQAVSDYDLVGRVKLMLISCLMVKTLGGDLIVTAQLYSKEIENSIDNIEALLDGAYANPAFTDDRILGILLC